MKYILIIALVVVAAGFVFRDDLGQYLVAGKTATSMQEEGKSQKKKDKQTKKEDAVAEVTIVKKWELPGALREVSGIAYLDEARFACIQDEEGTIFIYNHADEKIEKQIPFAPPGDYEDITIANNTAYIVRADGRLYQVPMQEGKGGVKEYSTPLTVDHNVEGLFFDAAANRLLLAIKDDEPHTTDYKGIYAFNLQNNTFAENEAYQVDLKDALLQKEGGKKGASFRPSALARHPQSNELYVLDGPGARLLVMDTGGKAKKVYNLGKDFPQAEGITFSPQGTLFISNEGKKNGTIIQTELP